MFVEGALASHNPAIFQRKHGKQGQAAGRFPVVAEGSCPYLLLALRRNKNMHSSSDSLINRAEFTVSERMGAGELLHLGAERLVRRAPYLGRILIPQVKIAVAPVIGAVVGTESNAVALAGFADLHVIGVIKQIIKPARRCAGCCYYKPPAIFFKMSILFNLFQAKNSSPSVITWSMPKAGYVMEASKLAKPI
ncbi:hypothetical protein D3C75_769010 [compost metagenome]